MDKETEILRKRLMDLGNQSFRNNMFTFTGFLSLAEQQIIYELKDELGDIVYSAEGGHEMAERVMVRFGNPEELGYEEPFPVVCVHIKPLMKKFSDSLTHRDFLGALMNLGIERNTLGDLLVQDNECYLFCHEKIADYICEELTKVKHTSIICSITEPDVSLVQKNPVKYEILVSSLRIDTAVAKVYQLSRSKTTDLFREKKIFVNGRLQENNSCLLKEGDTVTARGYGKFVFAKLLSVTKKEKLRLEIEKYE